MVNYSLSVGNAEIYRKGSPEGLSFTLIRYRLSLNRLSCHLPVRCCRP